MVNVVPNPDTSVYDIISASMMYVLLERWRGSASGRRLGPYLHLRRLAPMVDLEISHRVEAKNDRVKTKL